MESDLNSNGNRDTQFACEKHAVMCLDRMKQLYKKQKLTDVTLIAGDKKIVAHRLILSSASDYFSAMFTTNLRESVEEEVFMRNIDPDALQALIDYCYSGS